MTCRLELERQPEKPIRPVLGNARDFLNQQQAAAAAAAAQRGPPATTPTRSTGGGSRITPVMSTTETCNIIDSTIDSLKRSMAIVAEKYNTPTTAAMLDIPTTPAAQSQPLPETSQTSPEPNENSAVVIEAFKDESQMPDIMRVITKELSEPYSIYTYRYFIHNWPELCLVARDTTNNSVVGVIVCKLDQEPKWRRGYIAMLAVEVAYRRRGIGMKLVKRSVEVMRQSGCDEVMLETEVTNTKALALYGRLGFIRECRLYRYYLNGVDAFRLKLLFADCWPEEARSTIAAHAEQQQQTAAVA